MTSPAQTEEAPPAADMSREEIAAALRAHPDKFSMPANVKAALAERTKTVQLAAALSQMNWGKQLDQNTRLAIGAYLRKHGLDVTEIDVLGGNIYRNSKYYIRRLSEMTEAGIIDKVWGDLVHHDDRLETIVRSVYDPTSGLSEEEWQARRQAAAREANRRADERIARSIPDEAIAACVFHVVVNGIEFADAKWIIQGRTKKVANWVGGQKQGTKEVESDPVGEEFPVETAITRAIRRTVRLAASQLPALRAVEEEMDRSATEASTILQEARALLAAQPVQSPHPTPLMRTDGIYGDPLPRRTPEEIQAEIEPVRRETVDEPETTTHPQETEA